MKGEKGGEGPEEEEREQEGREEVVVGGMDWGMAGQQ